MMVRKRSLALVRHLDIDQDEGCIIISILDDVLGRLRNARTHRLIRFSRHALAVSQARSVLILNRTQTVASFLSVLTLGWAAVDYFDFEWRLWCAIALERCATAVGFLALARFRFGRYPALHDLTALAMLFAIPLGFLLTAELTFQLFGIVSSSIAGATAYYYLPFIMAAGLAIFPLSAIESALFALPIVAVMAASALLWPAMLGPASTLETLWRLVLIAGITGFAGLSQLRLLIDVTERAGRDGLTGAMTRQAGEQLLDMEFARATRHDAPLAVAFIDLDRFKSVNDRFGHEIGDEVLRRAVDRIQTGLRRQDAIVRWGGEEFLLVLGQTTAEEAEEVVERLGLIGLGDLPDGAPQTASIGLAERTAGRISDWVSLVSLADERMYAAKQAGRNRWISCAGQISTFDKPGVPAAGDVAPLLLDRGKHTAWRSGAM